MNKPYSDRKKTSYDEMPTMTKAAKGHRKARDDARKFERLKQNILKDGDYSDIEFDDEQDI